MQLAETLEAIQQAAELVFPGEHALNGAKALVEYGFFEEGLAASFGHKTQSSSASLSSFLTSYFSSWQCRSGQMPIPIKTRNQLIAT